MNDEGRGIMCARADAKPIRWRVLMWALLFVAAVVVLIAVVHASLLP